PRTYRPGTSCLNAVVTALGILEKYGRNLLKNEKPPFWESVKFQNVVFKTTVDCVQGTRDILKLLGYTHTTHDGLSIANEAELDNRHIASVTLDISMAKMELEEFIKVFMDYLDALLDCLFVSSYQELCTICGSLPELQCPQCMMLLCPECDARQHQHPCRTTHSRSPHVLSGEKQPQVILATSDAQPLQAPSKWICQACTLCNIMPTVLCEACGRPRQSGKPLQDIPLEVNIPKVVSTSKWTCSSCTLVNDANALVCLVCERPKDQTLPACAWPVRQSTMTPEMPMIKADIKEQDIKEATHEIGEVHEEKCCDRERANSEAIINILRVYFELISLLMTPPSAVPSVIPQTGKQQLLRSLHIWRQMRHLLAFYDLPSWGRAMLACKILNRVPDTDVNDVVRAVHSCTDIVSAIRYLQKECLVCSDTYPVHKMIDIIFCECSVCESCYKSHFSCIIKEKNIADLDCPICPAPTINSEENLTNLFSLLDTQVCFCPNGILHDGQQLKMLCPHCNKSTCSKCKKPWEQQHEGLICDEFTKWKHENDPEYQAAGLAAYLAENGIDCPKCKYRYALAKGGCMHFTCKQCKHAFCCCCNNAFLHEECPHPPFLCRKGLHAHHPRTCLYFLRDWDVEQLQRLLKDEDVPFNTQPPRGAHHTGRCHVMEQKDEPNGFRDEECGREVPDCQAGLCRNFSDCFELHVDPLAPVGKCPPVDNAS
uniref:Ring finger protein 31 n=1 Tax=Eptatretus burgeri TaxID=7764 RepID=A0A8C4QP05_EPTBU